MSTRVASGALSPPDGTVIDSVATAVAAGGLGTDDHCETVVNRAPELRLSIEEDCDPAVPESLLNYTVRYANGTSTRVSDLTLRVALPSGSSFDSASSGGTLNQGVVSWKVASLDPGESGSQSMSIVVDPAASDGTLLVADAAIEATGTTQAVPGQSRAVTALSRFSPLALIYSATPNPVRPGEIMRWELMVTNRGPTTMEQVNVSMLVPDWLSGPFYDDNGLSVGGWCPGGSCNSGKTAVWAIGQLASRQSRTFTMSTRIDASNSALDGTPIQSIAYAAEGGGHRASGSHTVFVDRTP